MSYSANEFTDTLWRINLRDTDAETNVSEFFVEAESLTGAYARALDILSDIRDDTPEKMNIRIHGVTLTGDEFS